MEHDRHLALKDALKHVLAYNWKDEEQDWMTRGRPQHHVFPAMMTLRNYMEDETGTEATTTQRMKPTEADAGQVVIDHGLHNIIQALVPLANLPPSIRQLIYDTVNQPGSELLTATRNALEGIWHSRRKQADLDDEEIPF